LCAPTLLKQGARLQMCATDVPFRMHEAGSHAQQIWCYRERLQPHATGPFRPQARGPHLFEPTPVCCAKREKKVSFGTYQERRPWT
jgi:hypothetical protein